MVKLRELITWTYKALGLINKSPGDKCSPQYKRKICRNQEIIKVRKWIPHIGPLTKVIHLKLFLDIVPSSSEDLTRAMGGQPKRFSRDYLRRNAWNVILYVLVSFRIRDVFCSLSRLFVWPGFRLFFPCLAVDYFAVYRGLGSSIKQASTATSASTIAM